MRRGLDMHFWITRGMARRAGVNLTEVMASGVISDAGVVDLIDRCQSCGRTEGCLAFLSEEGGIAPGLPDWCPNGALLAEIAALA